jgi:hypothetical protein
LPTVTICFIAAVQELEITTMPNTSRCAVCKVDMPRESWASHLQGKKHQRGVSLLQQKRDAEEKGIYVKGVFSILLCFSYLREYSVNISTCTQMALYDLYLTWPHNSKFSCATGQIRINKIPTLYLL